MNSGTAEHNTPSENGLPEAFDPGPPQRASAQPAGERWTLVFTQVFQQPREAIWSALTDPAELPAWAPYTADRNLGSVGPATLIMMDDPEPMKLNGEVTVAEAPAVLRHAWGEDVLRWELRSVAAGTELTLSHTLSDKAQLPLVAAGWHLCLLVVDRHLGGTRIGPIVGEKAKDYGWQQLCDSYASIINPS